ncbi:MAG: chitinase [Bacteroidota bacterium]
MILSIKKYHCVIILLAFFILAGIDTYAQQSNLRKYLTEKKWNELFPNRIGISAGTDPSKKKSTGKDLYSFKAFLAAADSFPQFLVHNDTIIQKRELCAFLANIAYENGGGWDDAPGGYYKWGLHFAEEVTCAKGCPQYSDTTKKIYPPIPGRSYHGRGPLQLSWNYNYGQFSEAYLKDKNILLNDPSLLTKDPVICFASALWFWTTPQFPKPSCHDIISGAWKPSAKDLDGGRLPGFGSVVNVINGGIECGPTGAADTRYRYGYYRFFCKYFNVDPGLNIECTSQKPFGQ